MTHNTKYQIHSRTMIHFGQIHVMRILIQYAPKIARYIKARGKKMNDQKTFLKRDGWISNDF